MYTYRAGRDEHVMPGVYTYRAGRDEHVMPGVLCILTEPVEMSMLCQVCDMNFCCDAFTANACSLLKA